MTDTDTFAAVTPDFVQDALAAIGLMGDGRLMPLNSYENRVYLAPLEPGTPLADTHPAVVLKFYRPRRWSTAQIEEEHAFALELAAGDDAASARQHAEAKARRKGADLLVFNEVSETRGFGDVPNEVVMLDAAGTEVGRAAGTKAEVARRVVETLAGLRTRLG